MCRPWLIAGTLALGLPLPLTAAPPEPTLKPLVRAVDLNVGEAREVELAHGNKATVKLLDLEEQRDRLRNAVRRARVKVEVNGKVATLTSANYHLPVAVGGVQVDCPVTGGYRVDNSEAVAGQDP